MLSTWDGKHVNFEELLGKTFTKIEKERDEIKFYLSDRHYYMMYHDQDCCESVYIEDVSGDLDDLVDTPILHADASTKDNPEDEYGVSMWTFYKLATVKGWVDIRWFGSSNGYYGVSVSLYEFDLDVIRAKKIEEEKYASQYRSRGRGF
jgi:hypothetical protein